MLRGCQVSDTKLKSSNVASSLEAYDVLHAARVFMLRIICGILLDFEGFGFGDG